ncbi:MAG: dTDP-4-dehydrorhamnose reductase [Actinomycetes bacterium]
MRLLVTGAAGLLGTELVLAAGRAGHEVVGTDARSGGPDLTDPGATAALLEQVRPDVVVHTAAFTAVDRCESEPDLAFAVNATAAGHVARAAGAVGAHLVHVSTDYVFDGTKDGPYDEDDEPRPQSVYGRSKLEGERAVGPAATVARTSWVCGEHGPNMVRTVLRLAAEQPELRFVDDQVGRPTFTADLATMLLQLAKDRPGGTVHTTNQGVVSWCGLARAVLAAAGEDPARVVPITTAELRPVPAAPRPANSVLGDRVWRSLGHAPARDFREPLGELVARLLEG